MCSKHWPYLGHMTASIQVSICHTLSCSHGPCVPVHHLCSNGCNQHQTMQKGSTGSRLDSSGWVYESVTMIVWHCVTTILWTISCESHEGTEIAEGGSCQSLHGWIKQVQRENIFSDINLTNQHIIFSAFSDDLSRLWEESHRCQNTVFIFVFVGFYL